MIPQDELTDRRSDPLRLETDRRRPAWRRFRRNYPKVVAFSIVALVIFLAVDAWLLSQYLEGKRLAHDTAQPANAR